MPVCLLSLVCLITFFSLLTLVSYLYVRPYTLSPFRGIFCSSLWLCTTEEEMETDLAMSTFVAALCLEEVIDMGFLSIDKSKSAGEFGVAVNVYR